MLRAIRCPPTTNSQPAKLHKFSTARVSEADREGKLETLRWAIKHKYAHPAALEEVEGDAAVRPE